MTARRALRIGTRRSALALAQAESVRRAIESVWAHGPVELVEIVTRGDRLQQAPTLAWDGRGLFVKELEAALAAGAVDLCVHSAKDVPPDLPAGLPLLAILPRADARDALCGSTLADLPRGAVVGTGSSRRALQLRQRRPDLEVRPVRGNVDTRLARLARGEFAALVLAAAGLQRLGRAAVLGETLSPEVMVPAAGQGALAVQARVDDAEVAALLGRLEDAAAAFAVHAERAVLERLGGGCTAPVGAYAEPVGPGRWHLRGIVCGRGGGAVSAAEDLDADLRGFQDRAALLRAAGRFGGALATRLLRGGAGALLAESQGAEGAR